MDYSGEDVSGRRLIKLFHLGVEGFFGRSACDVMDSAEGEGSV